ncbi:uncharacterized protein FOMMEDRAFT_168388 [Fomitiporia mediterranea MF3/22]|uniref:uncharacterized protein n=1 Tax=Fomitiporia mediterranea (strain MF3/22) TaxID=694068 RepID=UPI0004407BAC|nr:uncharacterized protein FOMMEDRAFT_168388 [Fomitiporia mediterranea MF3/22]EJD03453.1 hypothetical protein FOMMEDRAFT_168388 [Fomitiporia mediterranea MF3/22]
MPEPATARNLGWQRFWFTIKHAVETYHDVKYQKPDDFRPGEMAHARGVVLHSYWDFLVRNGYELTEDERWLIRNGAGPNTSKLAKPVLVLRRLGAGKYIVCRFSSWGGRVAPGEIMSPMQRYFAFSTSKDLGQWPKGTKILRTSPPQPKPNAIIAIPTESKGVESVGWKTRCFLCIGQLERLEAMIRKRESDFPLIAEKLRLEEAELQRTKRKHFDKWTPEMFEAFGLSPKADSSVSLDEKHSAWRKGDYVTYVRGRPISLPRNAKVEERKYRDVKAPRLRVCKPTNLINWPFDRSLDEFIDCNFHMDPARRLGRNINYGKVKYMLPRAVDKPLRSETPHPDPTSLRRVNRRPPAPSLRRSRSLSTVARLCKHSTYIPHARSLTIPEHPMSKGRQALPYSATRHRPATGSKLLSPLYDMMHVSCRQRARVYASGRDLQFATPDANVRTQLIWCVYPKDEKWFIQDAAVLHKVHEY